MSNTIQVKRGANASLPTLNVGEFGFSTDTHQAYIGDGATNHELVLDSKLTTVSGDLQTNIDDGATTANWSGVVDDDGHKPTDDADVTATNLQSNGDFELDRSTEADPKYWHATVSGTPYFAAVWETSESHWPPWKPEVMFFMETAIMQQNM